MTKTVFKFGYVAIIGEPNAGKSTLMNQILGEKLSIVTRKPQTTRKKILGIHTEEHFQIVFLDTPGVMMPKYKLHTAMLKAVDDARDHADVLVLILDVAAYRDKATIADDQAFKKISGSGKPVLLVLNKIDLITKEELLETIDKVSKEHAFVEIVPLSASKGMNVKELVRTLAKYLPDGEAMYDKDILSNEPERFFVSEIIREKIFDLYADEIPYSTEVEVTEFVENHLNDPKRKDVIRCNIIVERESQKGIVIGDAGTGIKEIGSRSRRDIESFLGRGVFLELFVKVRKDWRENESHLKSFGY
jgi:GTP-binding protein Era